MYYLDFFLFRLSNWTIIYLLTIYLFIYFRIYSIQYNNNYIIEKRPCQYISLLILDNLCKSLKLWIIIHLLTVYYLSAF